MGALFPFSLTLESRSSRSEPPARDVLARLRTMPTDARIYQILFLGILLAAGAWLCDFSLRPTQIVLTFASAIGTQHIISSLFGRTPISYRSALITALSLTLLLRTDTLWAHPLAATVAIS